MDGLFIVLNQIQRVLFGMNWAVYGAVVSALYVGYLVGQYAFAERLRRDGYNVHVWQDYDGRRRYSIEVDGLEDTEDVDDVSFQ